MLTTVVLDLDGVLRRWDPTSVVEAEQRHGLPAGCIHEVAFAPLRLAAAVTGRVSDAQWRAQVLAELIAPHGSGARAAVAEWSAPVGEVDAEVLALVRRFRLEHRVALFTNATDRLPADLAALRLDVELDAVFNSSELGLAKPDPRAFEAVCEALRARPGECLLVDDSPANVAAARAIGMRAHLFTTASALALALGEEAARV